MTQNGISYVLNASNSCPKPDFICDSHFMRIPVNDNYCEKLLPWLDKSIEFIGEFLLTIVADSPVLSLQGLNASSVLRVVLLPKTLVPSHKGIEGWGGRLESFCSPSLIASMLFSPFPLPCSRQGQGVQLPGDCALLGRDLPVGHHCHRLHHEDHGYVVR